MIDENVLAKSLGIKGGKRKPGSRVIATYPDGSRFEIRRVRGMWEWMPGASSSSQRAAIENAEARGATVKRETA